MEKGLTEEIGTARVEEAPTWSQRWASDPEQALEGWADAHEAALQRGRIAEARNLVAQMEEVALDQRARAALGDTLWAKAHVILGAALASTPTQPRQVALSAAIQHYQAALEVYNEEQFPREWGTTQNNLGNA